MRLPRFLYSEKAKALSCLSSQLEFQTSKYFPVQYFVHAVARAGDVKFYLNGAFISMCTGAYS